MGSIWLTYHNIYRLKQDPYIPLSAAIYHVSEQHFREQLQTIQKSGRRVIKASEFPDARAENTVAITFDDGWLGAFEIGLPLLQEAGFKATFFVTRNFVGSPGCCTENDILKAVKAGMDIGIHGITHRMLSSCSSAELEWEWSASAQFLESLLGQKIQVASVPGGAVNSVVTASAKAVGLTILCTSQIGINRANTSLFNIKRVAIRRATSTLDVERYCRYNVNRELLRWAIFQIPRSLLGMRNYSRLRRRLLDNPGDKHLFEP